MKESMKAKDKLSVETIRSLLSAIQYEEMSKKVDSLSDAQSIAVLKSELKKQQESLEFAKNDNRTDLCTELERRIQCINAFLPKQMTEQELEKVIGEIVQSPEVSNMGAVMQRLKADFDGQYDGKMASSLAKRVLESRS